jgi:hypothetical protein
MLQVSFYVQWMFLCETNNQEEEEDKKLAWMITPVAVLYHNVLLHFDEMKLFLPSLTDNVTWLTSSLWMMQLICVKIICIVLELGKHRVVGNTNRI